MSPRGPLDNPASTLPPGTSTRPPAPPTRIFTPRAIALGLLGTVFICTLTAFNDYVLGNTFLIGNFLPVGLLLFFVAFVLLVNAPLSRFLPRRAFAPGELGVALAMTLVSCTLPSSGLMRYLPSSLVGITRDAGADATYRATMQSLHLPDWLFPSFASSDWSERANEPVITTYVGRAQPDDDTFAARVRAVPWRLWARPAFTWGVLLAALYGAVLCMAVVVRHQWAENERLPFPLATVYTSLIEPPEPGRALNSLLASRLFYLAAGGVFAIHATTALHNYYPRFPAIPIAYDLRSVMGSVEPWRYTDSFFQQNKLYFCVIGICYFLQTRLAFSLWFFFIAFQCVRIFLGTQQTELADSSQVDQSLGAQLVFALSVLWVGRKHWMTVLRQMFRGAARGEPEGRYLPYRLAGWGLVACCCAMSVWFFAAGASTAGALALTALLALQFITISRLVAETGLIFCHMRWAMDRPWLYGLSEFSTEWRTTPQTVFLCSWFTGIFAYGQRENPAVYATHALRVADNAAFDRDRTPRRAWPLLACLGLSLLAGYVLSGASMLYVEYSYDQSLARNPAPINDHGLAVPAQRYLPITTQYMRPRGGTTLEPRTRLGHFAFGAGLTAVLAALRLRFVGWPLHPIGFLLVYTYPLQWIWFSVFLGWVVKVLLVSFGGAGLYRKARPVFIGLILGEAAAAAFWLLVSIAAAATGATPVPVNFLPG